MRLRFMLQKATWLSAFVLIAALTGCVQQATLSTTSAPAVLDGATIDILAADGDTFPADGSAVSFFLVVNDGFNEVVIDDRAEPWLEELVADPPNRRSQTTSGNPGMEDWATGTLGEYIVPATATTGGGTATLTVPIPQIKGLREPATVWVKALAAKGDAVPLTYMPPPRIGTITRYGRINGEFGPVPLEDVLADEIDFPGFDDAGGPVGTVVPSQVATPVAIDGWNIPEGATYEWFVEGTTLATDTLENGRFAFSPEYDTVNDGPARVGLRITDDMGQEDEVDLALLLLEPPVIQSVVRADAVGNSFPWSAQEIPAKFNADCAFDDAGNPTPAPRVNICGLRLLQTACDYVVFSSRATGEELGRFYVPNTPLTTEVRCIDMVVPPVFQNITEPTEVVVQAIFADGSYTQPEAIDGVNVMTVVPAPQIDAATPAAVPATPTATNEEDNEITLTGSYIHPSSKVQVRWAFVGTGDTEVVAPVVDNSIVLGNPADLVFGPNDGGYIPNGEIDFDGTAGMTFRRPALDLGRGARDATNDGIAGADGPIAAAKTRRGRIEEDRNVEFVVCDIWGQTSADDGPEVTYNAPPLIYNFQVTNLIGPGTDTPATRTESFLLTGLGWDDAATVEFVRQDNGQTIATLDVASAVSADGGTQSFQSPVPAILADALPPRDGNPIEVWAILTNADGQEVVATINYLPAGDPLVVTHANTGFPEVGAVAASERDGAPAITNNPGTGVFGRNVRIDGFNGQAVRVEFLTADGNLIDNRPALNDNPIELTPPAGAPVTVPAPQLLTGITEDTEVYVRIVDSNGQTTPPQQYGVILYKAPPSAVTIAVNPDNTMPASQRFERELQPGQATFQTIDTVFDITGMQLASSRPFLVDQGGHVMFEAYVGAVAPGDNGFQGYVQNLAPVTFPSNDHSMATGDTPQLAGVVVDQPATIYYYDLYGQEVQITDATINVIAPPVVNTFRGLIRPFGVATATIVPTVNLVPGRGAPATQFDILGSNLTANAEFLFRLGATGDLIADPNTDPWEALTVDPADNGQKATGTVPQDGVNGVDIDLPFTRGDVRLYVRSADGQVATVNGIEYTAPPVIVGYGAVPAPGNPADVFSNQFIGNPGPGDTESITLVGVNLSDSLGSPFEVALAGSPLATGATVTEGPFNANGPTASLDTALTTGGVTLTPNADGILTDVIGPINMTLTTYTGQTQDIIGVDFAGLNPSARMALTGDNLFAHSFRGRKVASANDPAVDDTIGDQFATASGVFGTGATAATESLVVVSYGRYPDQEPAVPAPKPLVPTMKVELYVGAGGGNSRQLLASGTRRDQVLVQATGAPPTFPQYGGIQNDTVGAYVVTGNFTGDANTDVAVGVPAEDGGQGAVYIFTGDATGLAAVSVNNPIRLQLPAALTPAAGDNFGAALGVGGVTAAGNTDLVVGAPGRTVGGNANVGQVFVYTQGSIAAVNTAPVGNAGWTIAGSTGGERVGTSVIVGELDAGGTAEVLAGTGNLAGQIYELMATAPADPFRTAAAAGPGILGTVATFDAGAARLLRINAFTGRVEAFTYQAAGEAPVDSSYVLTSLPAFQRAFEVESMTALIHAETPTGVTRFFQDPISGNYTTETLVTTNSTSAENVLVEGNLIGAPAGSTAIETYVVVDRELTGGGDEPAWGFFPRSTTP